MRNVYRIAKTELRMLFCSPIMWVLLLIFVMQASGIFSGLCWRIAHNNEWGGRVFFTRFLWIYHGDVDEYLRIPSFLYPVADHGVDQSGVEHGFHQVALLLSD